MKKEVKADLALLLVTVIWGASFPITCTALRDVPPYMFTFIRYIFSGLLLFFMFFSHKKNIDKKTLKGSFFIGTALFFGSTFQTIGLMYTNPSKSGFITGLNVVLVPIFIAIIYKKLPDLRTVIGIICSVIGLAFISYGDKGNLNIGDFLTLLGAVSFAAQILLVDKYTKDTDIIMITSLEFITAAILALFPAIFVDKFNFTVNTSSILSVSFMTLFCTIGAYGIQNKVQSYTNPLHAAIIFLAEPIFGAIFSAVFMGDRLTGKILIGCIFIFSGMGVISIRKKPKVELLEKDL